MQIPVTEFILQKKAIIFDLFHTLTPLESSWSEGGMTHQMLGVTKEAWNEQLLEKSRDRLIGKDTDPYSIIRKMAHSINPNISDEIIQTATQNRLHRFEKAIVNISEKTITTLHRIKEMNKKMGLLSNADVTEIMAWDKSPIAGYFDSTVFSCRVGMVKPEIEIYEYILKELQVTPEEAVFIGDGGSNELYGAQQAGLSTILITGIIREIWPDRIESRKTHADYVIESITELV